MKDQVHFVDVVRRNLSYFWSVVAAIFLIIVTLKWGDKPEILTLLIGFVLGGGAMAAIMGTYFNTNPSRTGQQVTQNADTISNSPAVGAEQNASV